MSEFMFTFVLLIGWKSLWVSARPSLPETQISDHQEYDRSIVEDAATYLLVPAAVVVGTEGAILGATGVTLGDGLKSVGEGIRLVGDEIKTAGDSFTSISRGLKGLSGVMYQWGTGGSQIPLLGKDSDLTDTIEVLGNFSPEISRKLLDFYFHSLSSNEPDDPGDQEDSSETEIQLLD